MVMDMTQGKPFGILWRFSLPLLVSVLFQQLYNIVDSIVAGQFIGTAALAAVGASYPITMIFMAFATGSNIGVSVVISQFFGAGDYKNMKTAVNTSLISILAISIMLTVAGLFSCTGIMRLLSTPDDIFADSRVYLNIYIAGLVFLSLYNICTGVFTALGDSLTPLCFLIASSIGNIVLDVLFVTAFHMGVAGVAWATFLAQGVSSLLAAAALLRRLKALPHDGKPRLFSPRMLGRISIVAVPSILQQAFLSVGNLAIQGLVNSFGSAVIAGYSGAIKLNTFALTSFTALANGLSTFSAQNIGAGKLERVSRGLRAGTAMVLCMVAPLVLLYVFGGTFVMRLFGRANSAEVIVVGSTFLRIAAPFYFAVSMKIMIDSVLRGAGSMVAFMITTFSDLLLRVGLAYPLSTRFGATGIWLSWPVGWCIATMLSAGFYFSGIWKRKYIRR